MNFSLRILFLFSFLPFSIFANLEIPEVPKEMDFCGVNLKLEPGLQEKLRFEIKKIYSSPDHLTKTLNRVYTFMPYVEEAFSLANVPADLKYICILESGFVGDAVSTSNAVGFWQFKEATAREVGLQINDSIDDRKHVFHSSIAAAKYFWKLNKIFDNWIFAIIGYNQGPTGALPYIDVKSIGQKEMVLKDDLHFYALKSLAHKIAYAPFLADPKPLLWLAPMMLDGGNTLGKAALSTGRDSLAIQKNNLWLLKQKLPFSNRYAVLIPHGIESRPQDLHKEIRKFFLREGEPDFVVKKKIEAQQFTENRIKNVEGFIANPDDPDAGIYYTFAKENESLIELSMRTGKRMGDLREWNHLDQGENPGTGQFIQLEDLSLAKYHIAGINDTWESIAVFYNIKIQTLKKRNLYADVVPGYKIWLRKKRPFSTPQLVMELRDNPPDYSFENPSQIQDKSMSQGQSFLPASWGPIDRLPITKGVWLNYQVKEGDALWRIARDHGTGSEFIKKVNGLKGNTVNPGIVLKIMISKNQN